LKKKETIQTTTYMAFVDYVEAYDKVNQ